MTETSAISNFLDTDSYVEQTVSESELGRDQFLTLFLTQLNNQDPLDPMDSSEFSSQLAEFSSLEQLVGMNHSLADIQRSVGTQESDDTMDYIGRVVKAPGNSISVIDGDVATGVFELEESAEVLWLLRALRQNT